MQVVEHLQFCNAAYVGVFVDEGEIGDVVEVGEDAQLAESAYAGQENKTYVFRGTLEVGVDRGKPRAIKP